MYQRKFGPKKLKPATSRANMPQRIGMQQKINIPHKKSNTPIIVGAVVSVIVILILIVAFSGGEEKAQAVKAKPKDFSALIEEAKECGDKGIALYDSVESSGYKGNLSDQEKAEIGSKVKEAMGLMSKAQGIYSQIENEGGTIPADAKVDTLGEKLSKARYLLKLKLE